MTTLSCPNAACAEEFEKIHCKISQQGCDMQIIAVKLEDATKSLNALVKALWGVAATLLAAGTAAILEKVFGG